ncbi:MAG TPA: GSCFA domain-containing protein [Bacteroidia bacterium]|nr:GSCFA domain-containing protein [Bacteroidia bacterium]
MKFHVAHQVPKLPFTINHKDTVFLTGSCFAENMALKMEDLRFRVERDPAGILFNPESMGISLENILNQTSPNDYALIEREGLWYSYFHHSKIHAGSRVQLKQYILGKQVLAIKALQSAALLVISFGTAFVYKHRKLKMVVGNCHKQPQQDFEKILLMPGDITERYLDLILKLRKLNPDLQILFTVSPVKYLRDGLEQNALSKASLLLATHKLVQSFEFCHYFPAYELLNDDLRDHRFYKEDLAHPNDLAIQYIWEKFSGSVFGEKTLALNAEIKKLNDALKHRETEGSDISRQKHQVFIEEQKRRIQMLDSNIAV